MAKYRIIKAKSINSESLSELIKNFQDWSELYEYYADTPKGRYLKELIKNIKSVKFNKQNLKPGESTGINYSTMVDIPEIKENPWINSENCSLHFIKDSYIVLQQPNPIFERILRLRLEKSDGFPLKSPFEGISISKLIGILNDTKSNLNFGDLHVYRVIFHRLFLDDEEDEYLEFNIKKKEVHLQEIKKYEKRAAKWHAFSIKVEIPTKNKPLKSISLRFDRYGKVLLYGPPEEETEIKVAIFLGKTAEKI